MPFRNRVNKDRERLISGEVADTPRTPVPQALLKTEDDNDDEIQEISPPSGHTTFRHPVHRRTHKSASLSLIISGLPQSPILTLRMRPRGPDVGKSIHKAAEASQSSPSHTVLQSQDRRRSVGSAKRMVPFSPSTQRSVIRGRALSNSSTIAALDTPGKRYLESHRHIVREDISGSCPPPSSTDSPVSMKYQIQLARKSDPRNTVGKSEWTSQTRLHPPARLNKAARKTSAHHTLQESESDNSDNSEEDTSSSYSAREHLSEGEHSWQRQPTYNVGRSVGSLDNTCPTGRAESVPLAAAAPKVLPSEQRIKNTNQDTDSSVSLRLVSAQTLILESGPGNSTISEKVDPPPTLICAFERISMYAAYLHKTNSLPFLLRNVRAGFRSWCRELHVVWDHDFTLKSGQVTLAFEYTDPNGILHAYTTQIQRWECPLCSVLGIFPNWEALKRHVGWDHSEVELEAKTNEEFSKEIESFVVRMNEKCGTNMGLAMHSATYFRQKETNEHNLSRKSESKTDGMLLPVSRGALPDVLQVDPDSADTRVGEHTQDKPCPEGPTAQDLHARVETSSFSRSESQSEPQSIISVSSHRATTWNDASNSRQPSTAEYDAPHEFCAALPRAPVSSVIQSISSPGFYKDPTSPEPRIRTPPDDPHGPNLPVWGKARHTPPDLLVQPLTYRPTGPHLYDHLSSLPLDVFGPWSWFVLDKEEEIFELTDVLDEDKVMCALWGRWILLNRPFFIANYLLGVEAFIEEYWLMIHQAAGWGALRSWLLMLVSRRFLKNIEMVHVLKRYNELVGRNKR